MTTEIDRVSTTTKFNETYLLQGDGRKVAKDPKELDGVKAKKADGTLASTGLKAGIAAGNTYTAGKVSLGKTTAKVTDGKGSLDIDSLSGALKSELDKVKEELSLTHETGANGAPDTWTVGTTKYTAAQLKEMGLNASGTDDIKITKSFEQSNNLPTGVSVDVANIDLTGFTVGTEVNVTLKTDDTNGIDVKDYDATYSPKQLSFDLQVGADSSTDNKISVGIESMSIHPAFCSRCSSKQT